MELFATARLSVRPLTQHDCPVLTEMLGDPEVMQYSVRGVCDEAATRQFIDWCLQCYATNGLGPWGLVDKHSGDLIGFCGIGPEEVAGIEEISLGYRLAQRYWHQGYATEAAEGVLAYAFSEKQVASVVVIIEPEHLASVRVAEKAGLEHYTRAVFHERPVRVYRMTMADWRDQRGSYPG
ncbi:GNAT family N-acetyltransferase [Marinobacterium lutimaris]|uniref:Protein N-acetyltransferase, RimJ/RimL family n=1 Tax=Marinobacterium lutimaris TaxID=568106 RepID=A0A1H5Y7D0_9GAMM|nr:GNAT family N-acetyltransferase [Marinobacterium lutimaris]SEG19510.1 Protein N-acetyltransferase, RimJ/RimL family [Marinobacterium lutimaris]